MQHYFVKETHKPVYYIDIKNSGQRKNTIRWPLYKNDYNK